MRAHTRIASLAAALVGFATLSGCITIVRGNSEIESSGRYVSRSTWDQIEPGSTTGVWVRGVLGEPESIGNLDDGTEIWRWSWHLKKERSGGVFLIFHSTSQTENRGSAWVQVEDGVVVAKGRDESSDD